MFMRCFRGHHPEISSSAIRTASASKDRGPFPRAAAMMMRQKPGIPSRSEAGVSPDSCSACGCSDTGRWDWPKGSCVLPGHPQLRQLKHRLRFGRVSANFKDRPPRPHPDVFWERRRARLAKPDLNGTWPWLGKSGRYSAVLAAVISFSCTPISTMSCSACAGE